MADGKILSLSKLREVYMDKKATAAKTAERERKANTVQVDLPPEEKRKVKAYCATKGVTMSRWVADAIRSAMKRGD